MYIRRKVFSLMKDENGEERYFSTTEISNKEEKESKSRKNTRIAGKVALGVGAGTALAGGVGEAKALNDFTSKYAAKHGLVKEGIDKVWGFNQKAVENYGKTAKRYLAKNKAAKAGRIADVAGTGLAATGAIAAIAARKKKKENK